MKRIAIAVVILLSCLTATAQRLPSTAVPTHYELAFTPDLNADSFAGLAAIHMRIAKPATAITVNAVNLKVAEATVETGRDKQTATVTTDDAAQTATFTVPKAVNGNAILRVRYSGVLNTPQHGWYISKSERRKYAVTQLQATHAREMFPSFDEPEMKATFDVSVTVDEGDTAISNGKIVSDTPAESGKHTIKFSRSPKMSTYLVALTVGDFKCLEDEAAGIPLRVCAPAGKEQLGAFAMEASKFLLPWFNQYYGVKYPFEKLDQIAVPDHEAGAMENTNAIIYRDQYLLLDEKTASIPAKRMVAYVVAHEMAHQWFGNLVTMKWWNDLWLNEGFATWIGNKSVHAWKPEWKINLDDVAASVNAMNGDSAIATRAIRNNVQTPQEIAASFDMIAYYKTAAVIRMLEEYVGEQAFQRGLNAYFKKHTYGNTTADDFVAAISAASGKPVDGVIRSYISNKGMPLVTAQMSCNGNATTVTLAQQRYFFDRKAFAESDPTTWTVPVCLKAIAGDGRTTDRCELINAKSQSVSVPGCASAVFPNAGGLGYYRFDFLVADWNKVVAPLTPKERIALVGNEWALVRVGRRKMSEYLALAEALKNDRTQQVLAEFANTYTYIHRNLLTDAERPKFEAWVRDMLRPAMADLGYAASASEAAERRQLRATLFGTLGMAGRDPEIAAKALEITKAYMADPKSVDPSLVAPALTVAAMHGDAQLYDQYMTQLKAAKSPEQRGRFLQALAMFRAPELVQRTLEFTLSPDVRVQEMGLLNAMMTQPATRHAAWQFLTTRYPDVKTKTGSGETMALGTGAGLFTTGPSAFCDAGEREAWQAFMKDHPLPGAEGAVRRASETINYCIDMKSQHAADLSNWLTQRGS